MITGGRSDWGLLALLYDELIKGIEVDIIDVGDALERPDIRVEALPNSDTFDGTCTAMGLVMLKLPQVLRGLVYKRAVYKCAVVLGDRFEILSSALACYNLGISVAHIEGSDQTYGSLDQGYRKCIRALAEPTLRFDVEEYGSLGCLFPNLSEPTTKGDVVVVFHPYKADLCQLHKDLEAILKATEGERRALFLPNNDASSGFIAEMMEKAKTRDKEKKTRVFSNIGRSLFVRMVQRAPYIIGNSSSGIIEAPSLRTATINVGSRQDGRMRAKSVIDCEGTVEDIKEAIKQIDKIDWAR